MQVPEMGIGFTEFIHIKLNSTIYRYLIYGIEVLQVGTFIIWMSIKYIMVPSLVYLAIDVNGTKKVYFVYNLHCISDVEWVIHTI